MPPADAPTPPNPLLRRPIVPIAIAFLVLPLIGALPEAREAVGAFDTSVAWALNGMLGSNATFDKAVGHMTAGWGARALKALLVGIVALHTLAVRDRAEVLRRATFWLWVAMSFAVVVFPVQEVAEGSLRRESPGKELKGWFNIEREHGTKARVRSNNVFPSGHGTALLFIAAMAFGRYRAVGLVLGIYGAFVLFWRCVSGAHWLSDILLGSLPLAALMSRVVFDTPLAKTEAAAAWIAGRAMALVWPARNGDAPLAPGAA